MSLSGGHLRQQLSNTSTRTMIPTGRLYGRPDTGSVQPSGLKTADDHCGQNNLYKTRINADVKSIGRQKK